MKQRISLLLLVFASLFFSTRLAAQESLLQSGPMLGYSEMREVLLWVQTTTSAEVKFRYREKSEEAKDHWTATVLTEKFNAYTARLIADEVEPGKTYSYDLYINDELISRPYETEFRTRPLWHYRTDPPAVKIAIGSCAYFSDEKYDRPGKPYGGDYEIFSSIHAQKPDLMVWLGDNLYYREADWNTWTGILYRNTYARSFPQIQPLLARTHHYAIWDDHDYGPNDADHSYIYKDMTREAFELFWGNPTTYVPGVEGNISAFQWGGVDFFLLDNRWNRSQNDRVTGKRQVLGDTQIEWLISSLKNSKSPFKFVAVGGQVLNSVAKWENYIRIAPEERQKLIEAIQKENITGVIFLTGDRHHTELSLLPGTESLPSIWDLTVSPLTSTAYDASDEPNEYRVPGTFFGKRNFCMLEVTGPRKSRVLKMTIFDTAGQEIWSRELAEEDL